ncbi:uncharacterized protein LOC143846406 isoform X2 [Tasmannia lanceolata]|uniref:uncharacterized protein LOC143846406 isoform X2 n=1 Tax=Tasmannia lanceolata TaxID=3420 RepID=UPI004062E664
MIILQICSAYILCFLAAFTVEYSNMPQDNLRSVVYRSLKKSLNVPYEGYEGSDETDKVWTSRKSKTYSRQIDCKGPNQHLVRNEETKAIVSKGINELDTPPSFQLLQVSKEAQKLNQMIDLWSKGPNVDGQSRDIARDLLKGALDLQESLIMLEKLQEASKFMAKLKRKQKPKFNEEESVSFEEMGSNRFRNDKYQKQLEAPRLSADGSSRDCVEELKKVIRDSLSRQNLLSNHSDDETFSSGRRKFDSFSGVCSESLSRSLTVPSNSGFKNLCYDEKARTDSSFSSMEQPKKAKKANLIAKLMGLEELPSETVEISKKEQENKKVFNQCRPVFEVDMPKVRKPQVVDRNADPGGRKLKEIIETMQLKGLLRSNHTDDFRHQSYLSNIHGEARGLDDELPPIVIIKPLHFPCQTATSIQEERVEDPKMKFMKSEAKPMHFSCKTAKPIQEEKVEDPKMKILKSEAKPMHFPCQTRKPFEEEKVKEPKMIFMKSEEKPLYFPRQTAKPIQDEGVADPKKKLMKSEAKELMIIKSTNESSGKIKVSVSLNQKQKKKELTKISIKADRMPKALPAAKKFEVKETVKSLTSSRSQSNKKPTKSGKPENSLGPAKQQAISRGSTRQNHNSSRSTQPISQTKKSRIKTAKPVRESETMSSVAEKTQSKEDRKEPDPMHDLHCISVTSSTLPAEQIHTETKQDDSEIQITDTNTHEKCSVFAEQANQPIDNKTTSSKATGKGIKLLLMSSPSFLNCAEELLNLNMNQPMISQTNVVEYEMRNDRLILDCANELMERKSYQIALVNHPMLQTHVVGLKGNISLDQLVEELIDGIENLRCYGNEDGDEVLTKDSLYVKLERDVRCKNMVVNGLWDLGWMNGISAEETDNIAGEVEKHLLSWLIEEVVTDLV